MVVQMLLLKRQMCLFMAPHEAVAGPEMHHFALLIILHAQLHFPSFSLPWVAPSSPLPINRYYLILASISIF